MTALILHLGSEKTGTSALQASFAANATLLRQDKVYYPPSVSNSDARQGRITSGNGLRLAKYLNPDLRFGFQVDTFLPHLDKVLHQANGGDVLYSSEFLERFRAERLQHLVEHAHKRGYDTRVIYYVRSIAGHALSCYSQAIKRSKFDASFERFLRETYKNPFRSVVDRVVRIVGPDNLLLFNFDEVRDNLLVHFLRQVLGVTPDKYAMGGQVNRSLTPSEIEFMLQVNKHLDNARQSTLISDALVYSDPEGRGKFVITTPERLLLEERYGAELEAVNAHIAGAPIGLIDSSIRESDRPEVRLGELERKLVSVIAMLTKSSERAT